MQKFLIYLMPLAMLYACQSPDSTLPQEVEKEDSANRIYVFSAGHDSVRITAPRGWAKLEDDPSLYTIALREIDCETDYCDNIVIYSTKEANAMENKIRFANDFWKIAAEEYDSVKFLGTRANADTSLLTIMYEVVQAEEKSPLIAEDVILFREGTKGEYQLVISILSDEDSEYIKGISNDFLESLKFKNTR